MTNSNFRALSKKLTNSINLEYGKDQHPVIILYGARRVGKSTLLKNSFPDALYIDAEVSNYTEIFNSKDPEKISAFIDSKIGKTGKRIVIIDEFQVIDNPGLIAKIIFDHIPGVNLIISGSSSLEIANKASESLAGRNIKCILYPLSFSEKLIQSNIIKNSNNTDLNFNTVFNENNEIIRRQIFDSLTYGLYPFPDLNEQEKIEYLINLRETYLFKDVLYLDLFKNTKYFSELLRLLAYQIGNIINITEISSILGISRETVIKYIEILKQIFVIYTLPPYKSSRRNEIGKSEKVYFYDIGLRNAVINDFSPAEYRKDFGSLFENFVVNEVKKINEYYNLRYELNFWKTKWGSEVDLILSRDNTIKAIEVKINNGSITSAFTNAFPSAETKVINLHNIADLII